MSVKIKNFLTFLALGIVAILAITVISIEIIETRIDLTGLAGSLEKPISTAVGRQVELDGHLYVALSLSPTVEISDVVIKNAPGSRYPVLARAGLLQCRISLWSLLFKELNLSSLQARDVTLNLASQPPPKDTAQSEEDDSARQSGMSVKRIDGINLQNISVVFFDQGMDRQYQLLLDQLQGEINREEDIRLELAGRIDQYPFQIKFTADALGSFKGQGRWKTAISGKLGGSAFELSGKTDHLAHGLHSESTAKLTGVDVGALLRWFGLAEKIKAGAEQVDLGLKWSGHDLASLLNSLEAKATLKNGYWVISDANTKAQAEIKLTQGTLDASPGKRTILNLHGALDGVPAEIVITGPVPGENINMDKPVRLDLTADIAGARLRLNSRAKLPLKAGRLSLGFDLSGKTMATLGQLLQVEMPDWGPYSLKGKLNIGGRGYELANLDLVVGNSDLRGGLSLDTSGKKPSLNLDLHTNQLQLNDFAPPQKQAGVDVKTPEGESVGKRPEEPKRKDSDGFAANRLLSEAVLGSFDAKLALAVEKVQSGEDNLGSGRLDVSLARSTLAVNRLEINMPGGKISAGASYKPAKGEGDLKLWLHMRNFDYGVLARRQNPEAKAAGQVSLNTEVQGPVRPDMYLFAGANGYLDLWVKPKDMPAGVMDLWAANMLMAVFKSLTSKDKSKINCLLAELRLTDGVLKQKSLVIDTTSMRVAGQADIDFNKQNAYMYLEPSAKYPQYFSLETPIEVSGGFADFHAGLASGGLLGTAVFFVTSPLHVPLRRLFGDELPADGCDICCQGLKKQPEKPKN